MLPFSEARDQHLVSRDAVVLPFGKSQPGYEAAFCWSGTVIGVGESGSWVLMDEGVDRMR